MRNSKHHHSTCPACNGKGTVPLPGHLEATLEMIPRTGDTTAAKIHTRLGITTNAASNRLADLRRLGLVDFIRDGQCKRYSRAVMKTPKP